MAPVASVIIMFLIVTGFAIGAALTSQGNADQELVAQFGRQITPWLLPALVIVLTALLTRRVARQTGAITAESGMLIGYIAGATLLALGLCTGGRLDIACTVVFALTAGAGWASALTGQRSLLSPRRG
jgi:predicted exporter